MSAWAVAGQSLSLVVGGAGLGVAMGLAGILWMERNRAADLQEGWLDETLSHYGTAAELATCKASRAALREGKEIDDAIPSDLGGYVLPDRWRVQPDAPATD